MTGSVVPPTTISDEAVEAAARALYEAYWEDSTPDTLAAWELITERDRQECVEQALAAVLAAVPCIEAGLREKIAADIEAEAGRKRRRFERNPLAFFNGMHVAARVARGTLEATK